MEVIDRVVDASSLATVSGLAPENSVGRHEGAALLLLSRRPEAFDGHTQIGSTERLVLADGGEVSGGGVREDDDPRRPSDAPHKSQNIRWSHGKITAEERARRFGHPGCIVWLTGLSGSGKSTIAVNLERDLFSLGQQAYVLDGDNMRHGLCSDIGFSAADRKENIRRIGEVAKLFADAGFIVITAFISPYRADRALVRSLVPPGKFIEVFVNAPLEVCEQRDPKGLYAKARAGKIQEFTGISAPYEPPAHAEIELRTDQLSVAESVARVGEYLAGPKPRRSFPPA